MLPSAADTIALGRRLGQCALPGLVIALYGRIGAGKTTFVQGLAQGLGVLHDTQSPTFTLVAQYDDGRLPLYHLDVYRLGDEAVQEAAMFDDYFYGDGVCAVEWAQLLHEVLPQDRLDVYFTENPASLLPEPSRAVTVFAHGSISRKAYEQWVTA